ncbi:MAG: LacI family transcriptional regulator [Candidatus Omnitrophica bacterium]|nr:LacI family transcriptional regulator [Candidatus Omnitrophota bacterium]MCM8798229.1 LacI family transcriptional regulator [Candidatus Omnitrophota bacterium]
MRLTIQELARRCGVSVATVSRALNPLTQSLLKSETLNKVKEMAKELGYRPQRMAKALRKGRTETLGLLMNFRTDTISGYVGEIMKGVLRGLQEIKYDLKLISREEFSSLSILLDYEGIDGIIITHAFKDTFPNLEKEIAENRGKILPLVVINDYQENLKINQLYVNSYKASKKLLKYLLDKGYKNFYLIGGEKNSPDAEARKKAFLDYFKKKIGVFSEERIFNGHFSEEGGYQCARIILQKETPFPGVFYCLNDAMAIGALRAIGEFGLNCPRDIKVVGFDGIPQGEFTNPPLTTLKFPLAEMGYLAVKVIYDILQGKVKRYISKEFSAELLIRGSG